MKILGNGEGITLVFKNASHASEAGIQVKLGLNGSRVIINNPIELQNVQNQLRSLKNYNLQLQFSVYP